MRRRLQSLIIGTLSAISRTVIRNIRTLRATTRTEIPNIRTRYRLSRLARQCGHITAPDPSAARACRATARGQSPPAPAASRCTRRCPAIDSIPPQRFRTIAADAPPSASERASDGWKRANLGRCDGRSRARRAGKDARGTRVLTRLRARGPARVRRLAAVRREPDEVRLPRVVPCSASPGADVGRGGPSPVADAGAGRAKHSVAAQVVRAGPDWSTKSGVRVCASACSGKKHSGLPPPCGTHVQRGPL